MFARPRVAVPEVTLNESKVNLGQFGGGLQLLNVPECIVVAGTGLSVNFEAAFCE